MPFGLRHYWKGHFVRELPDALLDGLEQAIDPDVPRGSILIEAIHGAAARVPREATPVGFRDAAFNISALGIWDDPATDDTQVEWARETAALATPYSLQGGGYLNYMQADEPTERVRAAFGAEAFERLQAVKRQYDPGTCSASTRTSRPADGRRTEREVRTSRRRSRATTCTSRTPPSSRGCAGRAARPGRSGSPPSARRSAASRSNGAGSRTSIRRGSGRTTATASASTRSSSTRRGTRCSARARDAGALAALDRAGAGRPRRSGDAVHAARPGRGRRRLSALDDLRRRAGAAFEPDLGDGVDPRLTEATRSAGWR